MILVLLGPPGAGKGTQAKMLSAQLSLPHISTGDMFRDHKARGTELGKTIQAIMDSGGLVTDDITNAMVKERLARPDVAAGFILDGYPRTTAQAQYLEALLGATGRRVDRVVSYRVDEQALVDRIGGRRSCPQCGAVYHLTASPPRQPGRCDKDGGALVLRDDDRPENVKRRMQEYAEKTAPLERFYQERRLVVAVEATGAPESILAATRRLLGAASG
jgi:adenylate kinase